MLKHICISDLHAGAITSLLTHLHVRADGKIKPVPLQASPVTKAFTNAMDGFLRAAGAETAPPKLVLLGDAFDLQFSNRQFACYGAGQFLKALKRDSMLSDEVIATAGNHDHSLWTEARMALLSKAFHLNADGTVPRAMDATPAFAPTPAARSALLSAVLEDAGFKTVDFRYPNIGFKTNDRMVVLHHGHFVEEEYRLMSNVKTSLFDRGERDLTVADLSSENAGWLDFAWSSLGDAADLGRGAEMLYQNLLTTAGFRRLSKGWADTIGEALSKILPMSGNLSLRRTLKTVARVALDVTLGKFRDTERYHQVEALSASGRAGVQWYLEGPTLKQITQESNNVPDDVTFVFGHTHKPFSARIDAKGYPNAVKVFNTGGWTLNGPRLDNAEGAALVLMDDKLNVAALRLFVTPRNGVVPRAYVEVLSDGPDADAFKREIEGWLDASSEAWETLATIVQDAYELRQLYLLDLTAGADSHSPTREVAE